MHIKRILTVLLLISCSFQVFSQSIFSDSLDRALAGKPDSIQQKILVNLFLTYSNRNYNRARTAGNKVLPFLEKLGDTDQLADFLLRLGQTEYTYGNHDRALQLYIQSAGIYKRIHLPAKEASVYNEIAVLHRKNKNLDKSKEYINLAFELFKHAYDTNGMATTLCNLGITNEIEGNTDVALKYYRQALYLFIDFKCDLCISYSFDYMAGAFKILHRFDSALYYENRSLTLRRKLDSKYAIAQSLMTLGEIYFEQKKYKEAITYFTECAGLCHRINFKDYERTAYEYLSKCAERTGNYKQAYQYHLSFTQIDDSLFNETRSRQINELQIRYETEKNENEIKSLQQQQQIKNLAINEQRLQIKNKNSILAGIIVFAIIAAAGGIVLYKQQRLKNLLAYEKAVKETEETERLRIAKDIHDDLGSGISKIHFLSQEILDKTPASESKKNVSSVIEISTDLIENMRDLVWELNTENTTLDNLIARIREYSADYLEDLPLKIVASYPDDIPSLPLRKMVYRNIFMVVKEALNNIVKHSQAVHVYIVISISDDHLNVSIKDDGIGFSENPGLTGNGLQNMKSRIQSIGGVLTISPEATAAGINLSVGLIQITKSVNTTIVVLPVRQ